MTDLVGKRLGEFEVVRELGRGGMGVVFEAVQTSLNRRVALKVLGSGLGLTAKAVGRFRREAEAAAKLHHTNIVPVYATGEEGGFHFYAMELIDGPSLDRVIAELRNTGSGAKPAPTLAPELPATGPYLDTSTPTGSGVSSGLNSGSSYFDTVAKIIADIAEALHHAHQNNVIHRDIKPGNLLLGSDGRLSVNDFGLARALEEPGMTTTGEFVGTPAYMAPEQIASGHIPVDHRCDIYSLGATLYELLTLRPPFIADRRDLLLAMVVQKEPPAPRRVNPKVPRDLETICLKCLEKDPDRRYPTAQALAEDLRRYVNRFAIQAKRAGLLTKAKKWVRRNPALAGAFAAMLLALGVAGAFAWRAHESEKLRAEEKRKQEEEALKQKRAAAIERGMVAALAADLSAAEKAVAEAELLGASPGEIRFLRGAIALFTGQPLDALGHLEQAVRLMPENVSALALLAVAQGELSNWHAARQTLAEAAALPAKTPEDKALLGQATGSLKPVEGLALMDEALAQRSFGLGHVFRADARTHRAQMTGTVADAEAALVDVELAKRLLPGNPFTLSVATDARLTAAIAYRRTRQETRWKETLETAQREADELARFPGNYRAITSRFIFGITRDGLGPQTDMTAMLREARKITPVPTLAFFEAYNLLCLGRGAEAKVVADGFPDNRYSNYVRFLVALGQPDGRPDARRAWERYGGPGRGAVDRLEGTALLFVVAEPGELGTVARELAADKDKLQYTSFSPSDLLATFAFLEGAASESEFLNSPIATEVERCRRHYLIAWKRLAAGDRVEAKKAFEAAHDAMLPRYLYWWGSRAVLLRMNTDPEWPRAIPMKKKP